MRLPWDTAIAERENEYFSGTPSRGPSSTDSVGKDEKAAPDLNNGSAAPGDGVQVPNNDTGDSDSGGSGY